MAARTACEVSQRICLVLQVMSRRRRDMFTPLCCSSRPCGCGVWQQMAPVTMREPGRALVPV